MFNRPVLFLIAVNGLALFGGGIVAFEGLSKPEQEPALRHALEYDKCLARGRTVVACDAEARVRMTEVDQAHDRIVEECAAKTGGNPNNPSIRTICLYGYQ